MYRTSKVSMATIALFHFTHRVVYTWLPVRAHGCTVGRLDRAGPFSG